MKKTKGFVAEFKKFISRGNVVDLAVGMIVGSAFTAIVSSLVNDLLMPLIGWIFGGIDFTSLKYVISVAEDGTVASLNYGSFIQSIVNFLLVAFSVFLLVRGINRFRSRKEEAPAAPPTPSEEVLLLREIRDELKNK